MKIKKYRPNYFSGFEDVYYDVNSKEELLKSELCKNWVDDGYEICFLKDREDHGFIMSIKPKNNEDGAEWWVLAIIYNAQDIATLSEWLPDLDLKCEEYKNKSNKE
jgi:hypothetical protein